MNEGVAVVEDQNHDNWGLLIFDYRFVVDWRFLIVELLVIGDLAGVQNGELGASRRGTDSYSDVPKCSDRAAGGRAGCRGACERARRGGGAATARLPVSSPR
jgi:hypothetical protein